MPSALKTRFLVIVPVALAVFITTTLLRRADLDLLSVLAFGDARVHGLALCAALADLALRGWRSRLLARGLQRELPYRYGVLVQMVADGAAAVTPARMGADPAKFFVLRANAIPISKCAVILAGEASSEALTVGALAIMLALLVDDARVAALALLVYPVTVAAGVAFAAFGAHRLRRTLVRMLPAPIRFKRDMLRAAHGFVRHLRQLLLIRPALALAILLVALLHVAARAAVLPILLAGLTGEGSALDIVLRPIALQYGGALIPIPSGGGGIEAGLALALGSVVPAVTLLPALVWWRIYTFYIGAVAGLLALSIFRHRRTR